VTLWPFEPIAVMAHEPRLLVDAHELPLVVIAGHV